MGDEPARARLDRDDSDRILAEPHVAAHADGRAHDARLLHRRAAAGIADDAELARWVDAGEPDFRRTVLLLDPRTAASSSALAQARCAAARECGARAD